MRRKVCLCVLKSLLCLTILILPDFTVASQADRYGIVCDIDGKGLPFAEVLIDSGTKSDTVVTDQNGEFRVPSTVVDDESSVLTIKYGSRVPIRVSYEDFRSNGFEVCFTRKQQLRFQEEILALGRSQTATFSPREISKLEIYANASSKSDPLLALSSLPSSTNISGSADLQFRGSGLGLSQVYLNDVPLYEVVKGSPLEQLARGLTVFDASVVDRIELHPSNPPLFLANSSVGAVRVLPETVPENSKTVFLGLTGFGASGSYRWTKDSFTQFYGRKTDLSEFFDLNSNSSEVVEQYQSSGVAGSTQVSLSDTTKLYLFNSIDRENGVFNSRFLNVDQEIKIYSEKFHNLLSAQTNLFDHQIKFDWAYTKTNGDHFTEEEKSGSRNQYDYFAANISGHTKSLESEYRFGVQSERIELRSKGGLRDDYGESFEDIRLNRSEIKNALSDVDKIDFNNTSAYAYATAHPYDNSAVAVGVRKYASGVNDDKTSFQASIALESDSGDHKLIVGTGRYYSTLMPENVSFQEVYDVKSEQLSVDYTISHEGTRGGLSVYKVRTWRDDVVRDIPGIEIFGAGKLAKNVEVSASLITSRPEVSNGKNRYKAENYLDYFLKIDARYSFSSSSFLNVSFYARNGARFTDIVSSRSDMLSDEVVPIFSDNINSEKLDVFREVDISYFGKAKFLPQNINPFFFLTVSNALDRENQAREVYNEDFTQEGKVLMERRSVAFGFIFIF